MLWSFQEPRATAAQSIGIAGRVLYVYWGGMAYHVLLVCVSFCVWRARAEGDRTLRSNSAL